MVLAKSKYGHPLAVKLLRYGTPAVREQALQAVEGKMTRVLLHALGSTVAETGWMHAWDPTQKWRFIRKAYGQDIASMDIRTPPSYPTLLAKMRQNTKAKFQTEEAGDKAAAGVVRESINSLRYVLDRLAGKRLLGLTISHRLLRDYLVGAPPAEARTLIPSVRDAAAALLGSKEGGQAVVRLFALGAAIDRKNLIKALTPHLEEVVRHDQGSLVLCAALRTTDDTRLLAKSILNPLLPSPDAAAELACDVHARRVLLHLLVPADPRYFMPHEVEAMEPAMMPKAKEEGEGEGGEGSAMDDGEVELESTSKKPDETRNDELWDKVGSTLRDMVFLRAGRLIRSPHGAQVLTEVAVATRDPKVMDAIAQLPGTAYDASAEAAAATTRKRKWFGGGEGAEEDSDDDDDEEEAPEEEEVDEGPLLENASAHKALVRILKMEAKDPEPTRGRGVEEGVGRLAPRLWARMQEKGEDGRVIYESALETNRGAFTLVALAEGPEADSVRPVLARAVANPKLADSKGLSVLRKLIDGETPSRATKTPKKTPKKEEGKKSEKKKSEKKSEKKKSKK